ncbi:MAG TPA: hypothetical protein VMG82_34050 [Candidatus Sulfotelmatobacter sp.]|nr:hypothetical protein [Candidatus Sulfotelmatobacter sp.]
MSLDWCFVSTPARKNALSATKATSQRNRFPVLLALLAAVSLVSVAWAQDDDKAASDQKVKKVFYTAKDRLNAMHNATLFTPRAVADAAILEGPPQSKKLFQLHFNDKVICDFDAPGSKMGGKTPKFSCKITRVEGADGAVQTLTPEMDEEPVKVKFGADDNEVYAEIVATRLMWALGYPADAWFPVRVECHNCPENVISGSGSTGTRMFDPATIVRKYAGHKMYENGKEEQGWSWKELDTANARPTYERDGLKLLGAFMKHSDNKPPQQRLTCKKVNVDQSTNPFTTTCDDPVMLVQDVGATFGGGGWFTSNGSAKMNLGIWSSKKLWKKAGTDGAPKQCQATLTKSLTAHDGLSDPLISEEGRRFDAGLMCQLSDQQIEQLFRASRAAQMPEYHNHDGSFKSGVDEATVIKRWVDAFKQKREELANARCEWKEKPADLAVIDNPMSLSTVPNFCSAKPY